jgi:hypothetical protein
VKERSERAVFVESFGLDTFRVSKLDILAEWTAKIESRLGASARNNSSWHPGARRSPATSGQIVILGTDGRLAPTEVKPLGSRTFPKKP